MMAHVLECNKPQVIEIKPKCVVNNGNKITQTANKTNVNQKARYCNMSAELQQHEL
jgi:hypothetical protein